MCAYVNLAATNAFVKKHKKNKTVTVYKYLTIEDGVLRSPFRYNKWLPGVIKSNSKAKLQIMKGREINRGIHVYLNRKDAEDNADGDIVVKLTAKIEDLICLGILDEAVFRSVTFSKAEYNRIMRMESICENDRYN